MELEVDGERFDVVEREFGTYDLTWLTGPNPGYGFSLSCRTYADGVGYGVRQIVDDQELISSIRDFLAHVDPVSGFLG